MARILVVIVGILGLAACSTQRMICPAYQSAYIFDEEALRKEFSYFKEDSTPKILAVSKKNKYLIAVPESYREKLREMATVEMESIYPEIPDSLKLEEDAGLMLAEREFVDSASIEAAERIAPGDSAYAITKAKEKFNVDQVNYMWYFRDVLVLPDVRAALEQKEKDDSGEPDSAKKEKGGIGGFFRNLFGKKSPDDSTAVDQPTLNESDTTSTSKKGLFGRLKGKKEKKPKTEDQNGPAKKEENEGSGG